MKNDDTLWPDKVYNRQLAPGSLFKNLYVVGEGTFASVCMWKQEVNVRCPSFVALYFIFETRSYLELSLLACEPLDPPVSASTTLGLKVHWAATSKGDWSSGLHACVTVYSLSHLSLIHI